MASFIDKLLSGKYPKLESLWVTEFERMVNEVFNRLDLQEDIPDGPAGLDSDFDESETERELNVEVIALRGELQRLEEVLKEERSRHEVVKRELGVVKAELKAAKYKLSAIQTALGAARGEPIG